MPLCLFAVWPSNFKSPVGSETRGFALVIAANVASAGARWYDSGILGSGDEGEKGAEAVE